jgi:hypothetical protein
MEKRLHPLFQQSANQPRIQAQFDPTPANLTENLAAKTATSSADVSEFVGETKLKLNRMNQKIVTIEDRLENFALEVRSNFSKIAGRLNEHGLNDTKIESLIERHNNMIHAFEKKLIQMAKLLEDSQAQLITTQGALEDARREIARLKKI